MRKESVMRFMLEHDAGIHLGKDGKVFKAGEIVESDVDLAAKFRNKFQRLPDAPAKPARQVTKKKRKGRQRRQ